MGILLHKVHIQSVPSLPEGFTTKRSLIKRSPTECTRQNAHWQNAHAIKCSNDGSFTVITLTRRFVHGYNAHWQNAHAIKCSQDDLYTDKSFTRHNVHSEVVYRLSPPIDYCASPRNRYIIDIIHSVPRPQSNTFICTSYINYGAPLWICGNI